MKKKEIQNFKTTIKTTIFALGLIWKKKGGKILVILQNMRAIFNIFPPIILAVFPGMIINELINEKKLSLLIFYVSVLLVVPVLVHLLNTLIELWISKLSRELNLKITADFYEHVVSMDYSTIENPDIQVIKDRSSDTLGNVINVSSELTSVLSAVIQLLAISSIISTLSPFIILLVILILIVNSVVTKKVNYKTHTLGQELSQHDRFLWAYTYMLGHFSYAKEIRLFRLKDFLIDTFVKHKSNTDKLELKMLKTSRGRDVVLMLTNFFQQLSLYAYLIYCVLYNGLSIGSMTIYMSTVGQFSGSLSAVFNAYLRLENHSLKIQELMEFLNMPLRNSQTGSIAPRFNSDAVIEFRNVSFRYPGSERYALKNLTLTFRANEKLCIVGANGSGKSTFIKLLTRLYVPTEGEIFLNGLNIGEYDYEQYQRLFSPVFQDFVRYYFTLEKNIILSNNGDRQHLEEVCSRSGLNTLVEKLPKGYETQVGKFLDEEGFEPSGGEDQRIAIARAVYHGGEIFLLDEPTAALDPRAEYEIYTKFNEMITNKSAILITHRLSAVQLADKIAVFDNGQVAEYGTHEELYAKGGIYTEMFDKQAQFYRDVPSDSTNS